jgi:hypothetical protein
MQSYKNIFTIEEEILLKEISIESDLSIEKLKSVIGKFNYETKKASGVSRFVVLPVSSVYKDNEGNTQIQIDDELIDITKFCRVKPFRERGNNENKNKKIGCLLCSESTGKFGTIIIHGLTIRQVADLYKQSGVPIAISKPR